jgi:hypothetical protein
MKKQELTQELLKQLIDYNPDTGVFVWKERPLSMLEKQSYCNTWNTRFANKQAGRLTNVKKGFTFRRICIFNKEYQGHHIAFLYMTGKYPEHDIDCIDGDYTNLEFKNIRECTRQDTTFKAIKSSGKNKLIGSSFKKDRNKYRSQIDVNGKSISLGHFDTEEQAHNAYVEAKRQISPEFCMF